MFSGVLPSVMRMVAYRAMKIGIWTSCGPRQPSGFTPFSRYSFMVSSDRRLGSE